MAEMKLTAARRKALQDIAKSARNVARRCKAGTATYIGQGHCFKDGKACCVFGHVLQSAFPKTHIGDNIMGNDEALIKVLKIREHPYLNDFPAELQDAIEKVAEANDQAKGNKRLQKAVIAPLRELASLLTEKTKPGMKVWADPAEDEFDSDSDYDYP